MKTGREIEFTGIVHVKLRAPDAIGPQATLRGLDDLARACGAVWSGPFLAGTSSPASTADALGELVRWHTVAVTPPAGSVGPLDAGQAGDAIWSTVRQLLEQPEVDYAEPDAVMTHPTPPQPLSASDVVHGDEMAWHLREGQTDVIGAWRMIHDRGEEPGAGVVIAHLDTGFTDHPAIPKDRFVSRGVDFWDAHRSDASDPLPDGIALMPGHGTGTLCILAADTQNYKGVATASRVLPVRISPSVIHVATSSMAKGIVYAVNNGAAVITISMGGIPSQLWADAVNFAYDRGVVVCAAAGNNFALPLGLRTPAKVVYPARFGRVIAVTGMRRNGTRYWTTKDFEMCGNYGEESDICAPTPDVMWAQPGGGFLPGGGTSAATPQVAGAAALWLSFHRETLRDFAPAEKVEACRLALFRGAEDRGEFPYRPKHGDASRTYNEYYGDGRLNVARALAQPPVTGLPTQPKDDVRGAFWNVIGGLAAPAAKGAALADAIEAMWACETVNVEGEAARQLLPAVSSSLRERLAPVAPAAHIPPVSLHGGPKRKPQVRRLRSNKLIVLPPRLALVGGSGIGANSSVAPTRAQRLAVRTSHLADYVRQHHAGVVGAALPIRPAPISTSGATTFAANAAGVTGAFAPASSAVTPRIDLLPALGAYIIDGKILSDSGRAQLRQEGALIFDDVEVPLMEPTGGGAGNIDPWYIPAVFNDRTKFNSGNGIVVGVLDTGIDATHVEFSHKTKGQDFFFAHVDATGVVTEPFPSDAGNHGTHVCGLIAGRNVGVAPGVTLAVASVLNTRGIDGGLTASREQVAKGLNWLLSTAFGENEPGVHLINLSLGSPGLDDYLLAQLSDARQLGTLTIAAIGNLGKWGPNNHCSPANYDIVVGVGAVDRQKNVAYFSDWGAIHGRQKPDICAPGVGIVSCVPNGEYESMNGTSMATPIVCAAAALLLEQVPALRNDPDALEATLLAQAQQPPTPPRGGRGHIRI